jgi:hypothetical protein
MAAPRRDQAQPERETQEGTTPSPAAEVAQPPAEEQTAPAERTTAQETGMVQATAQTPAYREAMRRKLHAHYRARGR